MRSSHWLASLKTRSLKSCWLGTTTALAHNWVLLETLWVFAPCRPKRHFSTLQRLETVSGLIPYFAARARQVVLLVWYSCRISLQTDDRSFCFMCKNNTENNLCKYQANWTTGSAIVFVESDHLDWAVAIYCHLSDDSGLLKISRDDIFNAYLSLFKHVNGFQDRRIRPLCHLSNILKTKLLDNYCSRFDPIRTQNSAT